MAAENGEFSFSVKGRNGLPKIQTQKKAEDMENDNQVCHDDSARPVKAQTLDELHSLQKKKSAPTTPITTAQGPFAEEERQKQQLQSIRAEGGEGRSGEGAETPRVTAVSHQQHHFTPTLNISDSALKFTHILYNLSPAGAKTGRSPRDKRVVKDETTADDLWWGKGSPNIEMDEHTFLVNRERAVDYLCSLEKVFVNDQFLNWDPEHRIKVRIVSARAYHSLFMHNIVMHYLMPKRQILSLHSGCNMGKDGDVALFFGLSGTGKTTLSTDHNRYLIGDDEHCWSDNGVSNIEGGCYAKCIDLSREKEPDIWNAIKFGAVVENVVFDEHTREVDYSDKSVTENTRAAYPIEFIPNAKIPCVGPHPKNVIILACDAFGVLPPVSKLSLAQTMYHFISGYTALVAGTEDGIKEPTATFSACFGAAFIMLHPTKYAAMLAEKMQKHGATGWLVNTGWSGGSYGSGSRIKLGYTRKIIDAIHSGALLEANYTKTEVFGLEIPTEIEGVPSEILDPANTWSDKNAHKDTLLKLGGLFKKNFEVFLNYKIGADNKLTEEILAAGPNF
ncbi:hypothetical protein DH2020_008456 [Rehmannia glutinosa]|uniref:phosphoenolpyruvate carboxykinase (ATP) n=1 Tax=Rehmannia glutinosa TaxID=99300 RepID=A0ABR0U1R0_REHGL